MTAVLEARGLHVRYGEREVLAGVDLAIIPGELVALVGPNGAGKSTLLHAFSGDVEPSSGTVEIDGRPLGTVRALDLARRRAVLTQSNDVSFPFTALEVVEMGRAPWRGRPESDEDDTRIAAAVEDAEVGPFLERRVTELSGGERARVAFSRVRAQSCAVILLDEPTASLDIRHQERVLDRLAEHARSGGAVVVVLHDLDLAAAYADRVVVLDGGRVRAAGAPHDAFTSELLTDVYRHPLSVRVVDGDVHVRPLRSDSRFRKEHPAHA